MARWLGFFSELVAIVVISEGSGRKSARIKKEISRSGILGFIDILAFRLYYKFFMAEKDKLYEENLLTSLMAQYPELNDSTKVHYTQSPNNEETKEFLAELDFDFSIARCKSILKEDIFEQAKIGTFVMHPGICPEYRNAHGCFWAMVNEDYDSIGMTLLKVDKGIDTGPVYGYYNGEHNLKEDSHHTIQSRVVFDNLPALEQKFSDIYNGVAQTIPVSGRKSGIWGQPWLSKYLRWKNKYLQKRS